MAYLRFEEIYQQNVIVDETKQHNDAKIVNFARISKFSEECGFGVDLNGGDVIFDGDHFHQKPRDAVTIAVWVRLFSTDGANSLFDTIGGSHSTHSNGQYHLETDGGAVRWFHRNEKGVIVFNVTTEDVIISHVWTHVAGTYDSKIGQADVYVNAKFIMRGKKANLKEVSSTKQPIEQLLTKVIQPRQSLMVFLDVRTLIYFLKLYFLLYFS